MSRLPRPNPSTEVRCRVALRQLGEAFPETALDSWRYDRTIAPKYRKTGLGQMLETLLDRLAAKLGCAVSDLRLDHDPALENRLKVFVKGVHVDYEPLANDPDYLRYRPHGTQFAGSHDVKTRIRGDNGQLSDNALAKKERRRLRKLDPKRKKAKIRSANRWPPRGSQKIQSRRKR
ncbi:MAG: hypothetical protein Q7S17_05750 [Xanthobacteraceae bacterium]|nr:hypothetical protein [Xanthobacteraceae bacterium]